VEGNAADLLGDREIHLDIVVKRDIVDGVAELALKARMNLVELPEAAGGPSPARPAPSP
jgi:hypothetical protein